MPEDKDASQASKVHDVVMVGAGPSSLAAAIYTTREDLDTLLLEKAVIGGLAAITDRVDNYPGFPEGLTGMELAQGMEKQAERFGAKIDFGTVTKLSRDEKLNLIRVQTEEGPEFSAKAVLIGTGSHYRQLDIPGEKEFYGRGIHFCATCDGAFYRDKKLIVIGGGNSAIQESIFLTRFASEIEILVRKDKLKASEILIEELQGFIDSGKIKVRYNSTAEEFLGGGEDGKFNSVKAKVDGKEEVIKCDGVFVFIGLIPNTQFLKGSGVELDEAGFVKTDLSLMTSVPGVFSSGDCRSGATMQIASATGEGATAALMIRQYIEGK
jgi:thioredoxin reductase (NADPH)